MKLELIIEYESLLKEGMLNSNVELLAELLSDDLIFTNHLGKIMTKFDDLEAHRSGFFGIDKIQVVEQKVQIFGDTAVVSNLTNIVGTFGGLRADSLFRFTRIWNKNKDGKVQIVVAQSTAVDENDL